MLDDTEINPTKCFFIIADGTNDNCGWICIYDSLKEYFDIFGKCAYSLCCRAGWERR